MTIIARDYNINISIGGGNRRGAFTGGNVYKTQTTLNSQSRSEDGEGISKLNLGRIFTIGLAFNLGQKGNELLGAYTNNRLRQKKVDTFMTFAKYGIGIAINPAAGATYAIGDLAYRGIQHSIETQKISREADYYKRLSGNTSNSGRRYRGSMV